MRFSILLVTITALCASAAKDSRLKRNPLAAALHARQAATSTPTAAPPSTADAQKAAGAINQIFVTLQSAVTGPLQAIQGVINSNPSQSTQQLRANPTYTQAVQNMTIAFEDAAVSTKQLLSQQGGVSSGGSRKRQSSDNVFTPVLTAFAGIANQAEQTVSAGPLGNTVFVDLFSAVNPALSDLFGSLNSLVGDLTQTLGGVLGAVTGQNGVLNNVLGGAGDII